MSRISVAEDLSTRPDLREDRVAAREGEVIETEHEAASALASPGEVLPPTLHVLPVSERPFFPGPMMPLIMPEDPWLETVERVGETPHKLVALLLTRNDGHIQFMAEGVQRFEVQDWISGEPPFLAEVAYPPLPSEDAKDIKAYGTAIINTVKELVPLKPLCGEELKVFLARFKPSDPALFADFAANLTTAGKEDLQDVLETTQLTPRMAEEIKGHRRPYIGALPGKLGKAIKPSYWQPIRTYRA